MMQAPALSTLKVDKVVDARGTACPGPLLEAKRAIAEVPLNGVMEVLSSDEGTVTDVPLWARKVGHEYLGTVADAGLWHVYLRRRK